jgi:hypothetical protein
MAKAKNNIHNLDTLGREIYRLQLDAQKTEEQLDRNLDSLRENFPSLFMNSFRAGKKNKANGRCGPFESTLKNEALNAAINKISGHIADRAVEGIDSLIRKAFHRKK